MAKLRAKAFLEGRGYQHRPGAEFECSAGEAARLVSIGAAERVTGDQVVDPAPAEPLEPGSVPAYDDLTKAEILEMLAEKIEIDGRLKRAPKKTLYKKLVEVSG